MAATSQAAGAMPHGLESNSALPACGFAALAMRPDAHVIILSPSLAILSPSLAILSPSLVILSPSLVILSEAKNPSISAQGRLRDESRQSVRVNSANGTSVFEGGQIRPL